MNKLLFFISLISCSALHAQEDLSKMLDDSSSPSSEKKKISYTFKTSRLINLATNEQVKHGELDFRIAHRFEDMAGAAGGTENLFGLDGVADIRFSFDYGISDRWAIGIARSKGAYSQRQVYDLNTKFKIIEQESNGFPIGISLNSMMTYTTEPSLTNPSSTKFYRTAAYRINYFGQFLIVRKINSSFSFILAPSIIHRNFVNAGDINTQFAVGIGARYKISKRAAIIADFYHLINKSDFQTSQKYFPPIGLGFELETGGHVFHVVLSNTKGLTEPQFITQGTENPSLGQIRLGFNISRIFTILKDND